MARRYRGSILQSSLGTVGLIDPPKSGMWSLEELGQFDTQGSWIANIAGTASTFSTADAGSYSFSTQNIGDAQANKLVMAAIFTNTSGPTAVTIAGSNASLIGKSTAGGNHLHLWGTFVESATTTATIAITMGSTSGRCICHTLRAYGARTVEAIGTSANAPTTSSTAYSLAVPTITAGEYVLSMIAKNASGVTIGFTAGSTLVFNTSSGAETGQLTVGLTNASTAVRTNHSITTTNSSGGSAPLTLYALMR